MAKPALKILQAEDVLEKFFHVLKLRNSGPVRSYKLTLAIVKALNLVTNGALENAASGRLAVEMLKRFQKQKKQHQNVLALNEPTFPLLEETHYEKLRELCANFITKAISMPQPQQRAVAKDVLVHLLLLHLVTGAPPRHQVFSKMELRHLIWREADSSYEIQMDGVDPPLKCGHPVFLTLAPRLSAFYKTWLTIFRPLYVHGDSPFVFPNTRGGCQSKFTPAIEALTLRYLDMKVPTSKFR